MIHVQWFIGWLKDEAITAYGLIVVAAMLLFAAFVGDIFGGIGDKIFKKKD